MNAPLQPGDRVSYKSPTSDRRLKATVVEHMELRARGEVQLIPTQRVFNRKSPHCQADRPVAAKVRWFPRNKLRKLPV